VGRPRVRLVGILVVGMLLAASCSGGGGESSSSRSHGSSAASSSDPGCQFIVAGVDKRETVPIITMPVALIDASARPTVCYDRVSFIFQPGNDGDLPPSYSVFYAKPPFAPGLTASAESLSGVHAFLEVMMRPASETDLRNPTNGAQAYKGNLRLSFPQTMHHVLIVELLHTYPQGPDPLNPVLVWVIGLDSRRPFTTDAANSPPRVNVLIMN
jgi:hypothetical protein